MVSTTKLKRRLRIAYVVFATLLVTNNTLPYLGMRDDSCQTMFSSLRWSEDGNNHVFMPQAMVGDMWDYYVDVQAELDPPPPDHGRTKTLFMWLNRNDRALNTEAMRVVVRQLCDFGHRVSLSHAVKGLDERVTVADACDDPRYSRPHRWLPFRIYESDQYWGGE